MENLFNQFRIYEANFYNTVYPELFQTVIGKIELGDEFDTLVLNDNKITVVNS